MLVKNTSLQKLQIKPLPPTSLNASFALLMGNGMIKHYTVSVQTMLTSPEKPEDLIMDDVRKETGYPDLQFEILPPDPVPLVTETAQQLARETFLLSLDSDVRKALLSYQGQGQLRQYNKKYKDSGRFSFFAPLVENRITHFVIEKLRKFCELPFPDDFGVVELEDQTINFKYEIIKDPYKSKFHKFLFRSVMDVYSFFSYHVTEHEVRAVSPAWYFSVTFEEKDMGEAIQALADDVNIIGKALNIKGNFTTGKLVALHNTVGNGGKVLAFFVSPYIDMVDRVSPEIWMDNRKVEQYVKDLGVKYYAREGEVIYLNGKAPYSNLVIGQSKHLGRAVVFMDDSDPMSEGLDIEPQEEQEAIEAFNKQTDDTVRQVQELAKSLQVNTITPEELDAKFDPNKKDGNGN
jgi:hypothetical protein